MANNKTVLVIDDEAYIRRVIQVKLKKYGYNVLLAKNGQEGFDIIQKQKPQVVISDINMPIMDGKALCEKINGLKRERSFLTIIITARIIPDDRNWIDKMQDTIFMEKPFSPSKIVESINQYFGGQG